MLAFVSSPNFVNHRTTDGHPERPDRIRAIHTALRQTDLLSSPNPFEGFKAKYGLKPLGVTPMLEIAPTPATRPALELVHTAKHIDFVQSASASGGGMLDPDTPVHSESYDVALLSAGAVMTACDAVMGNQVRRAFVAARPPGHHAEPERAMGFCLFANVAIAARHLQRHYGLRRIAVVDFDVHHGNGTQACLDEDPTFLFVSLHQDPKHCYPGTGYESEIGRGAGRGFTVNIPVPPLTGDADYLAMFDQRALPRLEAFKPEFLLISAGFDAHADDPLAQLQLTEEGFAAITQRLVGVADRHCGGKIVSALEGGYNLRALARSVVRHAVELSA